MEETMRKKIDVPLTVTVLLFGAFVLIPMSSAFEYSIRNGLEGGYSFKNYSMVLSEPEFTYYLIRSGLLALAAVAITLVVLVPTLMWLHLSQSKIRPLLDTLSLLPLVIPVVAFAVGAQITYPGFVQDTVMELPVVYFILALPYSYRALDIGLNSVPIKTLTEAARSSGGNWFQTIMYVIVPATRSAVLGTIALTFALSLGEYTMTVLLHWDTFPTWVTVVSQNTILGAIALSMLSLIVPFVLLAAVALLAPGKKSKEILHVE